MKLRKIIAGILAAGMMTAASAAPAAAQTVSLNVSYDAEKSALSAPDIAVSVSGSKLKVKWNKNKNAEKIVLYYSKDGKSYKKYATVSASKKSCTKSLSKLGLKKSDKIYVRARFYSTVGGKKVYSKYAYNKKGFAACGLLPEAELNTAYPYTTIVDKSGGETSGTVTFTDYRRKTASNGDYDYVYADVTLKFPKGKSFWFYFSAADYYSYEKGDKDDDLLDDNHNEYTITWNGKDYPKCSITSNYESYEEDDCYGMHTRITAAVPKGYDGLVFWLAKCPTDDKLIDELPYDLENAENLIMFRCK